MNLSRNLSRNLETMKNLPDRFSNLAFWRGVRKLRDAIVKEFEDVSEWGIGIEGQITNIKNEIASLDSRISALENAGGGGNGR